MSESKPPEAAAPKQPEAAAPKPPKASAPKKAAPKPPKAEAPKKAAPKISVNKEVLKEISICRPTDRTSNNIRFAQEVENSINELCDEHEVKSFKSYSLSFACSIISTNQTAMEAKAVAREAVRQTVALKAELEYQLEKTDD